jgi:hypothetical protein
VRWNGGVLEPIGGWERATPTPFPDRIRNMAVWRDNKLSRFILAASMRKLYMEYGEGFVDVTPTDLVGADPTAYAYGFGVNNFGKEDFGDARAAPSVNIDILPTFWTFSNWGQDMLAVSSVDGRLLRYNPLLPTAKFAPISSAPLSNISTLVTAERHVALLQIGGNPRRIGWCSREDYSDWNFASTTNTAGFIELETQTPLVKAVRCRSGNLVFSNSDVFLMDYIGLPYVYGFPHLGQTRLINPDTLVTDNGNAFWWATDGFKSFDGGAIRPMPCPVWDYVMGRANIPVLRTVAHGGALGTHPEIWWFYPSKNSMTCDSYVMTNYEEGWWAIGKLDRSAMIAANADRYPYMAGEDGHIYKHESGWSGSIATALRDVWAETSALSLGAGDRAMEINQALIASGSGFDSVQARFYTNRSPAGSERAFGPYRIRGNGYMDTRVSGRDVRMRFENIKNEDWSIGETRLDVAPGAGR